MIVCHCGVVSDREIRSAIACGAASECSIAEACGAGMRCGGCLPAVREYLRERGLPIDDGLDAPAIRSTLAGAVTATGRTFAATAAAPLERRAG